MIRQAKFTEKMNKLGWLNSRFFDKTEDVKPLHDCISRYYGWVLLN